MRSAANIHVKMAKVSRRVPDTSVLGSRSYHAKTKSKPASLFTKTWRKREVRDFEHKHPDFLTHRQEQAQLNKLTEKKVGVTGHFEINFEEPLFPMAIHTKTGMLFGQHFDGELPRNLNHVFLR